MLLAIDCGNTNIVFAVYQNPNEKSEPLTWRYQTNTKTTADEYASWLLPLLSNANINFSDLTHVLVSSVVPDVNFNLKKMCAKYFEADLDFISPDGSNSGLSINLPQPIKIGADQIVNAVAALEKYSAPCVVIDFGTATTFDIVNEEGSFIGGVIAPGVNLSVDAMYRAAALLPKVQIEKPDHIIGQNTIEAMQSGLYWGYVSMIEGIACRVSDEMGVKPTFIATGGLANVFTHNMDVIDHAEPLLTLEGLRLIHCRNHGADTLKSVA